MGYWPPPPRFRQDQHLWHTSRVNRGVAAAVNRHFDLSVYGIISMLDLLVPRYRKTACYGHFGRDSFPWERTDKAALLREDVGR